MLDFQAIGAKIHMLRIKHEYKQEYLADLLYVSRQAVSRWELGQTLPSIDNLVQLCKLFNTSFEEYYQVKFRLIYLLFLSVF